MKYLLLISFLFGLANASTLPLTSNTVLILNSFFFLFIIVSFVLFSVEQLIKLFKLARDA